MGWFLPDWCRWGRGHLSTWLGGGGMGGGVRESLTYLVRFEGQCQRSRVGHPRLGWATYLPGQGEKQVVTYLPACPPSQTQ